MYDNVDIDNIIGFTFSTVNVNMDINIIKFMCTILLISQSRLVLHFQKVDIVVDIVVLYPISSTSTTKLVVHISNIKAMVTIKEGLFGGFNSKMKHKM